MMSTAVTPTTWVEDEVENHVTVGEEENLVYADYRKRRKKEATAYAYTAATKKLELAVNKIKHFEQAPLNFVFGKDDCCGQRFYQGILDEVMMFKRTLNKAEIMQLATIGLNELLEKISAKME